MRRLAFLFLLIFHGSSATLWAQQYSLLQYTVVDGLPQSQVNAMVEDKLGYLWIGTQGGGIAQFNGFEFKAFNTRDGLLNNIVTTLTLDAHDNLWIVHPRGISKFDGARFRKFEVPQEADIRRIRKAVEFKDTLFFYSYPGALGKIYNDSVYYWEREILPGKSINTMHQAPDGELCFYLDDNSFLIYTSNGERKLVTHEEQFGQLYNIFNFKGEVLINSDRGLFSLNVAKGIFEKRNIEIPGKMIAYDSMNNFFWTMDQTTLLRKSWDGHQYISNTVMNDVGITQMIFDREGNTWLGTYGNGLFKYFIRDFDRWDLDIKAVKSIKMDGTGAFWMGSNNNGLSRLSNGKVKTYQVGYTTDNSVPDIDVSPTGEVWVASMGGLGRYDTKRDRFIWYTREDGLSSQYITDLDFDEKGGVWFGTGGAGLNYFDGKKFISFPTEGQAISAIKYFPKRKTLYFENELGLNALHDGKVDTVSIPAFLNTSIVSINIYKNSLILLGSTGAGIAIYNPDSGTSKIFTLKEGLISNFIYFVAADDDDYIWVGTEVGISRLKLNDQLEIVENLPFGYDNGLTGIETNQNAFFFNKKEKYFGLVDGVYQFNDRTENPGQSNKLHISNVEVFYGEFAATQFADSVYSFFKIPYEPKLPSDKNHITFYFTRVNKSYPKSVKYKYTLENFETTWSQASAVSQATYSNLPPGSYVFKVMATNNSGRWDTVPIEYSFTIRAPFYQTTIFKVFAILLIVGVITLISMNRVRQRVRKVMEVAQIRQEEQDKLRKEIARDFHDEMGNQLTRIINYVSLMKLSKNGKALELYDKVEDSAKYLYSGTRDFIWSIDPLNDELSKLFLHIRDFGEKLFNEKEISFRAFNEVKETIKIPYGFSREANLIFKEAMTNAFNHSQAKNVSFTLHQKDGVYEMKLEDDGIGFDIHSEKVNGIRNMRTRAERIKSTLTFERKEPGIEVKLILPKINIEKTWPTLLRKES